MGKLLSDRIGILRIRSQFDVLCIRCSGGILVLQLFLGLGQSKVSVRKARIPAGGLGEPLGRRPVIVFLKIIVANCHLFGGLQRIKRIFLRRKRLVLFRRLLLSFGRKGFRWLLGKNRRTKTQQRQRKKAAHLFILAPCNLPPFVIKDLCLPC